jgi:hypothetical protein
MTNPDTTSRLLSSSGCTIDKKHAGLLAVFDLLRRKRNRALYDDAGFGSHHDAEQALESAHDHLGVIRTDITARKP